MPTVFPTQKIFEACLDCRAGAEICRHRVNLDLRQKTTKEKTTKEKITKEKPTKEEENETYSLKVRTAPWLNQREGSGSGKRSPL